MSEVEVTLENVGGFVNKHTFKFKAGTVNIVEAPNWAGKSSLIKGITIALSMPFGSELSKEVAQRIGLIRKEGDTREPLIHVGKKEATIIIRRDNEKRICLLNSEKGYVVKPEGDHRFLLTSMLTRSSEVVRRIADGDSNFEWILREVSLAERYEKIKSLFEKTRYEISLKIDELGRRIEQRNRIKEELLKLQIEIKKAKEKERDLNKAITSLPRVDPQLENRRNELLKQISEEETKKYSYKKRIEQLSKEITEIKHRYSSAEVNFRMLSEELKNTENAIRKIEAELKSLPSEEIVKKWELELQKINDARERLREKEGEIKGELKVYEDVFNFMQQNKIKETKCPLCGEGTVTYEDINFKVNELKARLKNIHDEISRNIRYRNELYQKIRLREEREPSLKREKEKLSEKRSEIAKRIRDIKLKLEAAQKEVLPLQNAIKRTKTELKQVEDRITELREQLKEIDMKISEKGEKERKLIEELGAIREKIEGLDRSIENNKKVLEELETTEINEITVSLDIALSIMRKWLRVIDEVMEFIDSEIRREKMLAIERFNTEVKRILTEVGLTDLEIWIDSNTYNLHVVTEGKPQPLVSLSGAQKHIISVILQLALKEAYMRDEPFFLIDEVMLDFHGKSQESIMKYLYEATKKFAWTTIITKLGEGKGIVIRSLS